MRSLFVAAALAMTMGFLAPAQELGGTPAAWTGDYVYLVYELTHDPPPTFATRYRMTFSIEFSTRPDGTRRARIELEGAFPDEPDGMGLDGILPLMLHSPMMGLWSAYLDMVEPPLVPGETYELRSPPHYADMPSELAVPMPRGRLEIGEEELEVAGVIAVEATLTAVTELHGEETEIDVRLALPKDPVLPYPVWVRPPADDPAAAWMSEAKLVAFRLQPPPPTITVGPGESIQAAIDAAPEGATICLAEGEWQENLTIEKSLTLRGQGADLSGIVADDSRGPVVRVSTPEGKDAVQFVIEALALSEGQSGIHISGKAQVSIEGVTIEDNGWRGIYMEDIAEAMIVDTIIQGNEGTGINMTGSAQATIIGSTIEGNESSGIWILDSARATVEGSTIAGNRMQGIATSPWGAAQFNLSETVVAGNGISGIAIAGSAQATITGSAIEGNDGTGIAMQNSGQASIRDSTIERNGSHGLLIWYEAQAKISGSTIEGNGSDGIHVRETAVVRIVDSTIAGNGGSGIEVLLSAEATIEQSTIVRNERYGVALRTRACFDTRWVFTGYVTGRGNTIPGPDAEDGNLEGAVCPADLEFLLTTDGGELDRRE